jgi:hypothetical protein
MVVAGWKGYFFFFFEFLSLSSKLSTVLCAGNYERFVGKVSGDLPRVKYKGVNLRKGKGLRPYLWLEGICCTGEQVRLLAWVPRVGQRLSTLREDVTYPKREYRRCYLASLSRQARRSRGDEGAPVWWKAMLYSWGGAQIEDTGLSCPCVCRA